MDADEVQRLRAASGAVVRAERRRLDLTQPELAERAGLSLSTISRLEKAHRDLDLDQLQRIAVALGYAGSKLMEKIEAQMASLSQVKIPVEEQAQLDRLAAKLTERRVKRPQGA